MICCLPMFTNEYRSGNQKLCRYGTFSSTRHKYRSTLAGANTDFITCALGRKTVDRTHDMCVQSLRAHTSHALEKLWRVTSRSPSHIYYTAPGLTRDFIEWCQGVRLTSLLCTLTGRLGAAKSHLAICRNSDGRIRAKYLLLPQLRRLRRTWRKGRPSSRPSSTPPPVEQPEVSEEQSVRARAGPSQRLFNAFAYGTRSCEKDRANPAFTTRQRQSWCGTTPARPG